jgi:hypothetical protein
MPKMEILLMQNLKKSRFIGEWIEFEHDCNFDIMQMVQELRNKRKINSKFLWNT